MGIHSSFTIKKIKKFKSMCKFKKSKSFLKLKNISFLLKKQQKLKKGFHRVNGRNNQGKITVRHRGGGHKRSYRLISFKRNDISGVVKKIEYDPNRSARIALIKTKENLYTYILAPDGLKENTLIESGPESNISLGNALPLRNIPIFIPKVTIKLLVFRLYKPWLPQPYFVKFWGLFVFQIFLSIFTYNTMSPC